jgi:hypothetical protein
MNKRRALPGVSLFFTHHRKISDSMVPHNLLFQGQGGFLPSGSYTQGASS